MEGDDAPATPARIRVIGRALNATIARAPWLWPLLRPALHGFFDRAAPGWDERTGAGSVDHLARAARPPARRYGRPPSGSSTSAPAPARRRCSWPASSRGASVRGVDISEEMIRAAQAKVGLDPEGRIAFKVADAAALPYGDESFDLVAQLNMPPFFAEIARVLRPGGGRDRRRRELGRATPFYTAARRARARASRGTGSSSVAERRGRRAAPGSSAASVADCWLGWDAPMAAGDRHLLLVNPSAGGGRGARAAPGGRARAARARARVPRACSPRASSTAAREARAAAEAGEIPVVMSGDGLIGQVGGALAGTGDAAGGDPRRARQRPRPGARDPDRASTARSRCSPPATMREIDVGEVNGKRFLGIASCGFDSDANRIANEAQLGQGQPRLRLRRAAGARRLEAGARSRSRSTASASEFTRLLGRRRQQQGLRRRHVRRPRRRARRRPARRRHDRRGRQAALPRAACRRSSRASHVEHARGRGVGAPPRCGSRPTARSPSTPTATTSPTCRRRSRLLPRALRVIVPA